MLRRYGPAYLTAIGTMSSAATLAVSLQCAEKAADAGVHTATATLKEGYVWADGTTGPKSIEYTIEANALDKAKVRSRALGLLDQRSRSRKELYDRLVKAEFEPDVVEDVLDDLAHAGLVNDAAFAHEWVKSSSTSSTTSGSNSAFTRRSESSFRDLER